MPGMTGDDLAQRVRVQHPELPVLMVSGYADVGGEELSEKIALSKPFSEEALATAIAQAVTDDGGAARNQIN
jgi:FixJ family two-component response regulator